MKVLFYITLILFLGSCGSKTNKVADSLQSDMTKIDSVQTDTVLTLQYKNNFSDKNIINKSDRQVDLLFNGIDNYFGGHRHPQVNFKTECMPCEPIQEFMGGLLFAKRLLFTSNEVKYYKTDFNLPDSVNRISLFLDNRERINPRFSFKEGKATIKYIGVSCNDAYLNKVKLSFSKGDIVIDSLINAAIFEYDLDSNGQKEQYLFGSRSCSQELVALRIRLQDEQ